MQRPGLYASTCGPARPVRPFCAAPSTCIALDHPTPSPSINAYFTYSVVGFYGTGMVRQRCGGCLGARVLGWCSFHAVAPWLVRGVKGTRWGTFTSSAAPSAARSPTKRPWLRCSSKVRTYATYAPTPPWPAAAVSCSFKSACPAPLDACTASSRSHQRLQTCPGISLTLSHALSPVFDCAYRLDLYRNLSCRWASNGGKGMW